MIKLSHRSPFLWVFLVNEIRQGCLEVFNASCDWRQHLRLQQHVIDKMSTLSSHKIHFSSFQTQETFTNNLIHSEKRKDTSNMTFHSNGAHMMLPWCMDFTFQLTKSLNFPQPFSKNRTLIYLRVYVICHIFCSTPFVMVGVLPWETMAEEEWPGEDKSWAVNQANCILRVLSIKVPSKVARLWL